MTSCISEHVWEADLLIEHLTISPELQVRELEKDSTGLLIRNDIVEDYRELITEGEDLGQIEVIEEVDAEGHVTGRMLVADGFHRLAAHRRLGHATVHCRVRRGNAFSALLLAAQSNGGRGLQYTFADRLKVAEMLLKALANENLTWSDSEIARLAKIHRTTVAKVRADISSRFALPANRQIIRKGNQMYTMTPNRPTSYQYDELLDSSPFADVVVEREAPSRPTTKPARPRPHSGTQDAGSIAAYHPPQRHIPREEPHDTSAASNTISSEQQPVHDMLDALSSDANTQGVSFIVGWWQSRVGSPPAHSVINHTLPASQIPAEVRTALLNWLQSDE